MRGRAAMPLDELAELVIAADEAQLERLLRVEVALLLVARLEHLLLEAGGDAGLRDVDQQVRHFGLARQLPQQRAERALDVLQLALVDLEVHRLRMLGA